MQSTPNPSLSYLRAPPDKAPTDGHVRTPPTAATWRSLSGRAFHRRREPARAHSRPSPARGTAPPPGAFVPIAACLQPPPARSFVAGSRRVTG